MSLPLGTDPAGGSTGPSRPDPRQRRAADVVEGLLADITADLRLGPPAPDRRLGDLGLESISLVYLIAEVQQEFDLGDRLLRALRSDPPVDLPAITVEEFTRLVAELIEPPAVDSARRAS